MCIFRSERACGLPTAPAYLTRLRMLDLDAGKDRHVMKSSSVECFNVSYTTLQRPLSLSARGMYSRDL